MALLSEEERQDMLRLAGCPDLKRDMELIVSGRHNPLLVNGAVDMDRLLDFLTQYNEFINHQAKPFKQMLDSDMRL